MRKILQLLSAAVLAGTVVLPTSLFATCFIFVHGHTTSAFSYSDAREYWMSSRDMAGTVAANGQHYYVAHYNALNYYWDGAVEVAGHINSALSSVKDAGGNGCVPGETRYVVVAHSMGNAVMDFIFGNSRDSDPYYNYQGANFKRVADNVTTHVSVQGAHGGSYAADGLCSSAGWAMNFISGVVGSIIGNGCDNGTASLQTSDSWSVKNYANAPRTSVYLISGYEGIFGTSALLGGEDDGVLAYGSTFACADGITQSYSTSSQCTSKQEVSGFYNCDQAHENHDDGRNDKDRDTRKSVSASYCWTGSAGQQVRSAMSTAQLINTVWAGDTVVEVPQVQQLYLEDFDAGFDFYETSELNGSTMWKKSSSGGDYYMATKPYRTRIKSILYWNSISPTFDLPAGKTITLRLTHKYRPFQYSTSVDGYDYARVYALPQSMTLGSKVEEFTADTNGKLTTDIDLSNYAGETNFRLKFSAKKGKKTEEVRHQGWAIYKVEVIAE